MIPNGWKIKKIKDFSKVSTGSTPLRSNKTYFTSHDGTPWVKTLDLNNSYIEKTQELVTEKALKETSLRVYPPHTLLVAMYGGFNQIGRTGLLKINAATNQAISAIQIQNDVEPNYLLHYLNANIGRWKNFAASSRKDPNISKTDVEDFEVTIPPLNEQEKIIDVLNYWDENISRIEKEIKFKKERLGSLIKILAFGHQAIGCNKLNKTKKIENYSICAQWNSTIIGNVATEYSQKNSELKIAEVLSCTKHKGFVRSLDFFGKQVFSKDLSGYKIIKRNMFGFPSNHVEEGSIGLQNIVDVGLVSPIYTVFESDSTKIDSRYLFVLLKAETFRQLFQAKTKASVDRRGSLRWHEFAKIEIPFPSIEEQKKISNVLDIGSKEIELLEHYKLLLIKQKLGLMQQLLTGKKE